MLLVIEGVSVLELVSSDLCWSIAVQCCSLQCIAVLILTRSL